MVLDWKAIGRRLEELQRRREAASRAVRDVDFIAESAVEHWTKDGLDFYLCENRAWQGMQSRAVRDALKSVSDLSDPMLDFGQWNGYVKFPKLPGILPGYRGIYTYIPVHGGLTFFQEWADGSCTYGFDCCHGYSGHSPIKDKDWVKLEAESMGRSIRIAARFEKYYLKAGDDNRKKARVLDRMGQFLPVELGGNTGIMFNLLGGEL